MKKKKQNKNATLYGEFVCSEFAWLPINKQKENAKKLEDATKSEENKDE